MIIHLCFQTSFEINLKTINLKTYEFSVVAEILMVFSSERVEKTFNIKEFIDSYNKLSNYDIRRIKQYFIKYINLIEKKFEILKIW